MTSANVSNMTMQVAVSKNFCGKVEGQNSGSDFMQVMSESLQGGKQDESKVQMDDNTSDKKDALVKVESKPNEIKSVEKTDVDEETATKIIDETEKFAEEVKNVISEELGVSEEEIVEAMETLGLTFLDLTDKTNLTQLVSKLTNCESNVALLVNESFVDIVNDVRDLTEDLLANTQCSVEELQTFVASHDQVLVGEEVTTEVADVMPEVEVPLHEEEVIIVEDKATVVHEDEEIIPVITQTVDTEIADATEDVDEDFMEMNPIEDTSEATTRNSSESKSDFSDNNASKRDGGVVFHHQEQTVGMTQQTVMSQYEPMTGEITLQTGEVVDVREIIDQIVEQARTTITSEDTTLEMLLNPEGLGKILMEVTHRDGKVTAHIFTQDENVKQALEHQMIQLKEQMNQGGTKVTSIEVSVGTHEFERNLEEGQQQRQQGEAEQQRGNQRTRNLNLNNLDELSGLMTEEEELVTKIMRENGNTVNYTA